MKTKEYVEYMVKQAVDVLDIDSPTGFTKNAADHIMAEYKKLGFAPKLTTKGGVIVDLGGKNSEDAILVEAHMDTLGGMVCKIKDNGNLELTPLGGFSPNNGEAENCRIYTRDGKIYEGTFQLNDASVHVNDDYKTTAREFKSMEIVVDEEVSSADDTKKLGIMIGDIVAFEPRTRVTKSGYIKSRFLDDKLSVGILLGQAKYLADNKITPERRLFHHITVYEEVGHGACGTVPDGVTEILSVDMGCIGDGLDCKETQVSICAKDSAGPYNYDVVSNLIKTAKDNNIDFAVDVYPHYGSDADAALNAGYDVRHGLIGAGVYASHGYERSHKKGVENTFKLLINYIK
ncbi:Putative aminopeptidase FrvX [Pseudobutyrivibrio sp. NOR37]|uniref:M42 family metallopeptidase n=1 Tax=Pseudobutyrivibrio xylanivorans TaxID=185007 RepID=A0A6M0LHI4_PSEXY|nr:MULTISPECIES: M42 family metallopeptidase [Pseudobutyrivibrio]NEX00331.1 M42 family metallopeptidase [Pseudobutyrivibrio xylanivorans]SFR84142.1 Putative aminopeptidase FrvX [Pseudobutyrivibrio sp. NOR37]